VKDKSIKLQRTESLLKELIPEALSNLSDSRINSLTITDVDCSKGKYDAKVYFDGSDYSKQEIEILKKLLNKVNGKIKSYILSVTQWYKCPNFTFYNDEMIQKTKRIEDLFAQIAKEKEGS